MEYQDDMTLAEARDQLREEARTGGGTCPCCSQRAQVYSRSINSTMAHDLIVLFKAAGTLFEYIPDLGMRNTGDFAKLRYWGLVEAMDGERADGSPRVGFWRVTNLGVSFVRGHVSLSHKAKVYDGRLLGFDDTKQVNITAALGKRFSYAELMNS